MADGELRRLAKRASADGTTYALSALGREYLRVTASDPEPFRMRLRMLGSNQTELETTNHRILFSYETPVAFVVKSTLRWFRSKGQDNGTKWGRTTMKHINRWVEGTDEDIVLQSEIEGLLDV